MSGWEGARETDDNGFQMTADEAAREAIRIRLEAIHAANRLLDRLRSVEFPLGELVADLRDEIDQMSRDLKRGDHMDVQPRSVAPLPDRPGREHGRHALRSAAPVPEEKPPNGGSVATSPPQPVDPSRR